MNPLPEAAVAPGTELNDPSKRVRRARSVLVYADLPLPLKMQLRDRSATLTNAESLLGVVSLLADRDFDAAIFDMTLSTELVKRIKAGIGSIEDVPDEIAVRARERHRLTPFFLVMGNEDQYAIVIDPPEHSYLESGKGLGLADAVTRLDVSKLVMRGAALA